MKEFFSKYNFIYQELKNEVNYFLRSLMIFICIKFWIFEVKLKFIFYFLIIVQIYKNYI